jgi:hypothetical protein
VGMHVQTIYAWIPNKKNKTNERFYWIDHARKHQM